ncbi:hypothetical protein Emag_004398 [Eimeria magna]
MEGTPFSCGLALWLFLLLATALANDSTKVEAAAVGISSYFPPCASVLGDKPSPLLTPPAFLSSAGPSTYTSSRILSRAPQTEHPAVHKQRLLLGSQRQSQRAVVRLRASAARSRESIEEDKDSAHQELKPSFPSRVLATGCYLMPAVDALQAFAPLPALGRLAGRLAWGCNVASMAASFLVLRKKLLPAPPFVKHHLMTVRPPSVGAPGGWIHQLPRIQLYLHTHHSCIVRVASIFSAGFLLGLVQASLLSMCSFTLANIHYKVLSFFLAGRAALHESLGFASGASLLSLICRAAFSAARGR